MATPDNIEFRIDRAANIPKVPRIPRAIAFRGLREAQHMSERMTILEGGTPTVPTESIYTRYARDVAARTVMVYLPQPGQETWSPDDVPDYHSFNQTRLRLIPSAESLIADNITIDDLGDPLAQLDAQKKGEDTHRVLHTLFVGGGIFVPPVGAINELTKMYGSAYEMARRDLLTNSIHGSHITASAIETKTASLFQRDSMYPSLQRDHYGTPDTLASVGGAAIDLITGDTIARYEVYTESGTMPRSNEVFVTDFHEEEAARQRYLRTKILGERVNMLWPEAA